MSAFCVRCGASGAAAFCASCGSQQEVETPEGVLADGGQPSTSQPAASVLPQTGGVGSSPSVTGADRLRELLRGWAPWQQAVAAATILVLILGVVAIGYQVISTSVSAASGAESPGRVMSGAIGVLGSNNTSGDLIDYEDGGCSVIAGGFADIAVGTAVTVYDARGSIVGTGKLKRGRWKPLMGADSPIGYCAFGFSVSRLPASTAYQVEVSHRGRVTVAPKDISDVSLKLEG